MPDQAASTRRHEAGHAWSLLEKLVFGHLGLLVIAITWAYGGQISWARQGLLVWGSLGIGLFLWALYRTWPEQRDNARRQAWRLLWPLALFDVLAGLSCLNPSFQAFFSHGEAYFKLVNPPYAWLPSSARPDLTLRELWQFNAIVLSCYNLVLAVRSRRVLRGLLFVLCANSVVLAIFGTFQKFAGATGPWFGLIPSRQIYFFSTFVYHNHWGAFTLLVTGACLGLIFRAWLRGGDRDFWHSPVLLGAVATLLLAITIPLSGSRSSTLLLGVLVGGALFHAMLRVVRERRARQRSAALPVAAIILCAVLAVGSIGFLAKDMIEQRARQTSLQLRTADLSTARSVLYQDTWRMAMVKPWFGWGLETYGDVFRIYNSMRAGEVWFGQPYYQEAHSDWLQSVAESGFVGTGLLVLLGVMPLWTARKALRASLLSRYLLAGCGLIVLYAWLEFPFANPAVMVAFWFCLYAATRYAMLESNRR